MGKHLCQILFFKKSCRPATLLKKRLWHRYFPVNFGKFSRKLFLIEHLMWLLMNCLKKITDIAKNSQSKPVQEIIQIIRPSSLGF